MVTPWPHPSHHVFCNVWRVHFLNIFPENSQAIASCNVVKQILAHYHNETKKCIDNPHRIVCKFITYTVLVY